VRIRFRVRGEALTQSETKNDATLDFSADVCKNLLQGVKGAEAWKMQSKKHLLTLKMAYAKMLPWVVVRVLV